MNLIDSFVNIPLYVALGAGVLLFIFLLISKIRATSKTSVILFPVIGILIAGLVYTYFNQHIIYPLVAVALAEILLLPYVIVIASGDPQKSDKKKNKKHSEEETQNNVEVAEIKEEIEERYKSILAANNEMTTKVSTFFNNEDAQGAFLEYFNKLIAEKTNGQKRKPVIIDGKRYISIKEASQKFGVSTSTIAEWCKKGHDTKGIACYFENNMHGNQQPSRGNVDKSTTEGSTTNG